MSITKTIFNPNGSTTKAAIILALVILTAYAPLIFLNQTYNSSVPAGTELHTKKYAPFPATLDPAADFTQIWPEHALAAKEVLHGIAPLWNPYIGGGQPLAADSDNYIFSPLFAIFLLPSSTWDLGLLVAVWGAGVFMFLFLRNIGLGFHSSLVGSVFYMLSGAFTWYLPHTSIPVILFTPLILYSMEKILQEKKFRHIPVASVAIACGILGAHIETIVLQSALVILYMTYRIIRQHFHSTRDDMPQRPSTRRTIASGFLAYLGGLGLSSFFILPVYEFLKNGSLGHDATAGIAHAQAYVAITNFVPYIMGPVQTYWSTLMGNQGNWNVLWGYVGIFALFFSVLGVLSSIRNKDVNSLHRYTPIFFFGVSVFFIMKTVGVPGINWIGHLPILEYIIFPRYLGAIIPIGFAVAGAFGIESLLQSPSAKKIGSVFAITVFIILLLAIPLVPYLSHQRATITESNVIGYVGFQILQAILFAVLALVASIAVSKNRSTIIGLVPLVLLELSLYIPMGLDPIWMAYKAVVILGGMVLISFFMLRPNRITWNVNTKSIRFVVIVILVIGTTSGMVFLSAKSPYVMVQRHDVFAPNQLTDYIKENIGNSRIFSLNFPLGPNYPSAYDISTLGLISAFNLSSFYSFTHHFIDSDAQETTMGYPPWTRSYGPALAQEKIVDAKKYFDFMGVKYFVSQNYDLGTTMIGPNKTITTHSTALSTISNSTGQSFVSPSDSISGIGISFYAKTLDSTGKIRLVLDSVPYDSKYHRESYVNVTSVRNSDFNVFEFSALDGIKNKTLYIQVQYPQSNKNNVVKIYYFENTDDGYGFVKDVLGGTFYQNGSQEPDKELAFLIITNSKSSHVFSYNNFNVVENKDAYPRAYLVDRYQIVQKDKAQDFLKQNPDFDLRHDVILEEQLPSDVSNQLQQDKTNGLAEITSYNENNVKVSTNSSGGSILVLTDAYYPGWKASVDGKETGIYKADGLVRAVFVPSGVHTVEFSYMPKSFVTGMEISLATLGVLVLVLVYYTIKKNKLK
ncbi:MAG: YfhO family protein [Thaumarchaeota archaeon]|nr:YfhO family protein [Nitrososphaerota archaeon]